MFEAFSSRNPLGTFTSGRDWVPAVDVSEGPDKIVVHMDVPGIAADDIDISLTGKMLTVKGERKQDIGEQRRSHHRTERWHGPFLRSVEIPSDVDADKVKAEYENGVLRLSLPKAKKQASKMIAVEKR
jgi:HSP20 family protein